MYCGKCGKEIEVTERFCRHCGAKNDYFKENFSAEDIAQGIKDRNEKAIEEFYALTYKQGFSVAIQIVKNEQDAMELLQDAYLSALTKMEQLESSAKIKSWFNCIVANRCRDWLRKKKGRNTQLFAELENDEYDEGVEDRFANENMQFSPDESVDYAETKRLMQEILDKLPEDQRLCILMYYYEELSVGEIAQSLECSTGTVKSRLNYARKKIKNEVEELERKGTKLYGIAPLPFIVWMLSSEEKTLEVKASGLEKWRQYAANSEAKQIAVKNAKTGSDHITESAMAGAGHIAESAKTGAGHIAKRAVAGIVAAAVVGTGAYIGYTKYIAKPTDTKQEQVKQENTAKQEKETIPEFTLTDEQKEQIQYAASIFMRAEREKEGLSQNDNFNIQIKKGKVSDLVIAEVANSIVYEDDSIKSEDADIQEMNEDGAGNKKFLMLEECQKFLEDTFEYKAANWEEVNKIFASSGNAGTDVFEAVYQGESTKKYNNEELCKVVRYAQTGKDEFHFWAEIEYVPSDNPANQNELTTPGIMEITAHRNDKSKIGGFVFDKITYKPHKNNLVARSIESTVNLFTRVKENFDFNNPTGTYDVNSFSDKEITSYINFFIGDMGGETDKIKSKYKEIIGDSESDVAYQMKVNEYKKLAEDTLGRTKSFKIAEVEETVIKGNTVQFWPYALETYIYIDQINSVESFDGNIKIEGTLRLGGEQSKENEYIFKAQGHRDSKSQTGVVVNKLVISNE